MLVKFGIRFAVGLAATAAALLTACGGTDENKCSDGSNDGCEQAPNGVRPELSRYARLTHAQWQNTVADLLGTELPDYTVGFRSDPSQEGYLFENDANNLGVDQALWQAYQAAASEISELVVADATRLAAIAQAAGSPDQTARAFIEAFGKRVHRRPLTESQVSQYRELYDQGAGLFPEMDAHAAGVRLLLQAFLQSPFFLYRVEGTAETGAKSQTLDAYDIAARLSYALWDTMPDDWLFQAAEQGELAKRDNVASYARQMLSSERARPVLERLHRRLFDVGRYRNISRTPIENLPMLAERENRLFIDHVVYEQGGSFRELLTSTRTFANAELAQLYGVPGVAGPEFVQVELEPSQRSGLLTQIGFLAANANSGVPDPIHRGVFVARRLACKDIPMPPPNVPAVPAAEGRTNRETVASHTETDPVCAGCHKNVINPFGFPFEYYDGLGRYRTEDNGQAVNGNATPDLASGTEVANAVELSHVLADSKQVHECYARHLLEFTFGRVSTGYDDPLIRRLATASLEDSAPIKELLVQLVSSNEFLTRSGGHSQ